MAWSTITGLLVFWMLLPSVTFARRNGADIRSCSDMRPRHIGDAKPQTTPAPFTVTLDKTDLKADERLTITLAVQPGGPVDSFRGFLIQVRKVGGETPAFGMFQENLGGATKVQDCVFGSALLKHSVITHSINKPKTTVTVKWTPPRKSQPVQYEVFYTVVQKKDTFWVKIPHRQIITVAESSDAENWDGEGNGPLAKLRQIYRRCGTGRDGCFGVPKQAGSEELLAKWRLVYEGCGESKGCFGIPGKCVEEYVSTSDNPTTCDIMVTWQNKGGVYEYQLTGRPGSPSGYIAVGLSDDNLMGKDSVVGCTASGSSSNPVAARYHNPEKYNRNYTNTELGLKRLDKVSGNIDGNMFCNFEQSNHEIQDGLSVDFDKTYYLLLSKAPSYSEKGLGKHPSVSDREVSPIPVHISDTLILGASPNNWLVQLHGGLMVIAWLVCASTGMFTARYYKLTHTDITACGKDFWFTLHISCMAATVLLTICGAVFIIIKKEGFDLSFAHPILGVIVVGLAIVQVILAFLRPHPGEPLRPYFNWIHWGIGNTAHIFGVVCILLANELSLADLKRFEDEYLWSWILLGIVLFHVLMHIVMSIHTFRADKQMDSNNKNRAIQPGPMKSNGLSLEAPGTTFRTIMLCLYFLVMATGAITLTALIIWPKKQDEMV